MKKIVIILSILFCLSMVSYGWAKPAATVEKPIYTFEPVIEGSRVVHTFVIKNTGDSVLEIKKVEVP